MFLPVWLALTVIIFLVRKYVVTPRMGTVKFGPSRTRRLMRFSLVMLVANIVALILGTVAALRPGAAGSWVPISLGLMLLSGLSLMGYFLDYPILYVYGLLLAVAPPVGEWLWRHTLASHHGFPVTFGLVSAVMILIGLFKFVLLLRRNPLPTPEDLQEV